MTLVTWVKSEGLVMTLVTWVQSEGVSHDTCHVGTV